MGSTWTSHILSEQFLLYSAPFFPVTGFYFLIQLIKNFGSFWNLCCLTYGKLLLWPGQWRKGEQWQPGHKKISVLCLLEVIFTPGSNLASSSSTVWDSLSSSSRFYLNVRLLGASSCAKPGGSLWGYGRASNSSISNSYNSCQFSCSIFLLRFANCSQLSVDDSNHR